MLCDFLTLTQLKNLLGTPAIDDESLMLLYDGAVDIILDMLGHSFGIGMRVWHNGAGAPDNWDVRVVSDRMTLFTYLPNSQVDLMFADYATLGDLAIAIESLTDGVSDVLTGWEAQVVFPSYADQPSSLLSSATVGATGTGYDQRQLLCMSGIRMVKDGEGEFKIFLGMPIHSVSLVCEDNVVLTENTDYWVTKHLGVLTRRYADGSQYVKYTSDLWSVATPNNVVVTFTPTWWLIRPAIGAAIKGLMMEALTTTGFKSEKIGDYSYTKDSTTAWIWLTGLGGYIFPLVPLGFL